MNGLERVDKPRQWPLVLGLGLVAVVVAGLVGWYYVQRPSAPVVQEAVESVAILSEKDAAETAATTNESVKPLVVTGVPPVAPEGIGQVTVDSAKLPVLAESPPVPATENVAALAAEADALLLADKKDVAREAYLKALAANPDAALRATIEEKLGKLNVEMIRLPWPMAEKQEYVVQENDAIKYIARKFGTTVEMIVKGNELKRPDIIRPGQRLKVFTGKMEIMVSKSRHDLLLSANGRFFKRYRVSTGRYEKTPVGSFSIADRIPEPPWHRDDGKVIPFGDKENILGTRWLAIKATGATPEIKGYGIHGTWDNASIGKSESAGCIRLKNEDVEELFEMVPVGTSVVIEE